MDKNENVENKLCISPLSIFYTNFYKYLIKPFCFSVGNTINRIPDNCQIKQVGCNQVAVSKADPSKPCKGPVGGVV